MKTILVAYDQNRGIGAENDLLWQRDLPADLAHFKELTMGGSLVMGRNTFDSIGRPLPGRQNVVVSHRPLDVEGVVQVESLDEAWNVAENEIFIIGGGTIYQQTLEMADAICATEVIATFPQATVFFPALDENWHETSREHHEADEKNAYAYDFVVYQRS